MDIPFLIIKRSYKEPETGDVFVLQPEKEVYYYGKVIQAKVTSQDAFVNGMYLIFIYDVSTNEISWCFWIG
jgi:hypothetical protein